jgi:hypothetical protein
MFRNILSFPSSEVVHTTCGDGTRQSVPKHLHIKFRHGWITQKKEYNIQKKAKIWNQELNWYELDCYILAFGWFLCMWILCADVSEQPVSSIFRGCSHHLWRLNGQSVPKRRHITFRRRWIAEKKEYNIQNMAKSWNQELNRYELKCYYVLAFSCFYITVSSKQNLATDISVHCALNMLPYVLLNILHTKSESCMSSECLYFVPLNNCLTWYNCYFEKS